MHILSIEQLIPYTNSMGFCGPKRTRSKSKVRCECFTMEIFHCMTETGEFIGKTTFANFSSKFKRPLRASAC